jgi:hypothetical protein
METAGVQSTVAEKGQTTGHTQVISLPVTSTGPNVEDEPGYPTGIKLVLIGFGLCLAVVCSNLVLLSPPTS